MWSPFCYSKVCNKRSSHKEQRCSLVAKQCTSLLPSTIGNNSCQSSTGLQDKSRLAELPLALKSELDPQYSRRSAFSYVVYF